MVDMIGNAEVSSNRVYAEVGTEPDPVFAYEEFDKVDWKGLKKRIVEHYKGHVEHLEESLKNSPISFGYRSAKVSGNKCFSADYFESIGAKYFELVVHERICQDLVELQILRQVQDLSPNPNGIECMHPLDYSRMTGQPAKHVNRRGFQVPVLPPYHILGGSQVVNGLLINNHPSLLGSPKKLQIEISKDVDIRMYAATTNTKDGVKYDIEFEA